MNRDPYDLRADPILFVLSGPSGAGKDTILHLVLEALKERAHPHGFVVTLNTRARRPEEVEGDRRCGSQRCVRGARVLAGDRGISDRSAQAVGIAQAAGG